MDIDIKETSVQELHWLVGLLEVEAWFGRTTVKT